MRASLRISLVQVADGTAPLGGGEDLTWRTAGVYRVANGRIAEAWLVPLDLAEFDNMWRRTRRNAFRYTQRVRPQDCAASGSLAHPRFLEFFEAAFIECWRARFGSIENSLGPSLRLTVAAVNVQYQASASPGDDVNIDVTFDQITTPRYGLTTTPTRVTYNWRKRPHATSASTS